MSAGLPGLLATGWSLHLPGTDLRAALAARLGGPPAGDWASGDVPPPERAAALLGRKGLLAKEPATRMALCAVHRALRLPAGQRPRSPVVPGTAVVACSNLGNVGTVAAVARQLAAEGGRGVSILDAPNVSSNVIASTVALWFGFGGPNLMVCSGRAAGRHGLRLAALLLAARRAGRVVLVGAEAADDVASALHRDGGSRRSGIKERTAAPWPALRTGAACLVLEAAASGPDGTLGAAGRTLGHSVLLRPGPEPWPDGTRPRLSIGPGGFDPVAHWGDWYGAQDIVALALAAHLIADEGHRLVAVSGEPGGGPPVLVSAAGSVPGSAADGAPARAGQAARADETARAGQAAGRLR
ncbi:MAG TPA: beta-ketoacyl synthase N-terminal-like domain-containing protein [Streptosporangiaceae bacterium]